jgi:hypothetical protein
MTAALDQRAAAAAVAVAAAAENNSRESPVSLWPSLAGNTTGMQGGLLLAIQAGLPVVPVAICGARRVMGRALGWRPMAASHCTVVVGRPVPTAGLSYEDRDAFCASLQAEVCGCVAVGVCA